MESPTKKKRGLANVSPERRREIARMGGLAAKNRHRFTREEAVEATRIRIERQRAGQG